MKRSMICAILFILSGIFYLIAAIKGSIPIYYIFGILLLLFGGLYIKKAITEKKKEEKPNEKNNKLKSNEVKDIKVKEQKSTNKKNNQKTKEKKEK